MPVEVLVGLVVLGIVGLVGLLGLALNGPRARRWEQRVRLAGEIVCGGCGGTGTLSVRTTSTREASSSNMALYCSRCGSSKWGVAEAGSPRQ